MRAVQRVETADNLTRDGQTLALYADRLLWLSDTGSYIFELTASPVTVGELAEALRRRFGEPADGSALDLTANLVDNLIGQGVLVDRTPHETT